MLDGFFLDGDASAALRRIVISELFRDKNAGKQVPAWLGTRLPRNPASIPSIPAALAESVRNGFSSDISPVKCEKQYFARLPNV
jgi:hypothetical protein